jgi:class 3 adenylate cyclase/energy-coupling factor transporter ATP-binding protein EcfA2
VPACARCGQENPEGARFCNACGAPLADASPAGEERRIVSILFVDLVGFTSRAETMDPEDVRAILTPYYEHVRSELERFGGSVEKFIGDAVMGVFGAPVAHGDDSERAVRAAFAVRDWAEREGLELRIAVNTGEAIVELDARPGHGEAMVAGDVVNTAARLQAAAPAGSVLVGEETHAATRNAIEYRPAQPVVAKGKEMPVRSWLAVRPVTGVGERPTAPVPLIGRDRELAVLTDLWNRVAADGKSRFVTVFGPSGIGKSRIALELAQLVGDQGGSVIRGRSTPYGASSPYSAFAQQIKQIAGIFDSDDADDARAKLVEAVSGVAGSAAAEEHAPHLAMLLGLETDEETADREQLFFSARVLVESLALKGPLLLLYDDIHWADGSLLDLLETLGGRVREAPVLFVALSRPELLGARPGWGGGLPAYTALPLDPLDESASVELAEGLLAGNEREEDVAAAVAGTAEGNPLFIEELVASLAERSTRGTGALPTSVRAIVAARLDSLPAAERTVLVDASVVGRVFWRGALAEITPREDLSQLLGSLETRDLVQREAVSRIKGDQQYAFKHGLIQEVAYATLPRAARRSRHAAAARFLEAANVASVSREALGRHWREAGEIEQAVHHLVLAGDQAGRGWAKQRAVELYREALELVPEDGAQRRDVLRKLAVALQAVYHLEDVGGLPAEGSTRRELP